MNIYDIAKVAGVSIATVSRILNGSSNVSDKTREKVEKILKEYNYYPSAIARGMVTNSMKTVGVIAIDIRDVYYANVTYIIEQKLRNKGYNVILCNTGQETENKKQYIKMLTEKKVDGLILVGSVFSDKEIESYIISISVSMPVILVNGFIDSDNIYCVLCDDAFGTSECAKHLLDTGKKKIVYLKDADTYSAALKEKGFKKICPDGLVLEVEKGLIGGFNGIKNLINQNVYFDAVMSSEDLTSIGAMKYIHMIGKRVPYDIAVAGFNNSIYSQCCFPELTTVDSQMERLGEIAQNILTDILSGSKAEKKIVIKPELIIRESTKIL